MQTFYNQAKADLLSGVYNLASGTYKCLLVQTTYVFDPDHQYVSDITGGPDYELNSSGGGTGYTAGYAGSGRKTLSTLTVTKDNVNDLAKWSFDPITWSTINAGTARALVVYKPNTNDADSKILVYVQFTNDAITNGGDLVYTPPATGVAVLS